jgi:hypothetical protein
MNKTSLIFSEEFKALLKPYITQAKTDGQSITLNFRDPSYSPEAGGFHPVEIMIQPNGQIAYITDFSYVGSGPYAELVKELDFDFSLGLFVQLGVHSPLDTGAALFQIWQSNFLCYHSLEIYEIQITNS